VEGCGRTERKSEKMTGGKGKVSVPVAEKQHLACVLTLSSAKLNPICHLLALLGVHHILHISRIRVKHLLLSSARVDRFGHLGS
jgi:hypothetical protein